MPSNVIPLGGSRAPAGRGAWGAAGERLSPAEVEQRRRARQAERNKAAAAEQRALEEAHRAWREGRIAPWRITLMLDARGLYGPEVDEACGVAEPAVDLWEKGVLYPTWEQLQALARLVDCLPSFFVPRGTEPDRPGLMFMCDRQRPSQSRVVEPPARVETFTREAIATTLSTADGAPLIESAVDLANQRDRLVLALARSTGDTPEVVRLKHGIPTQDTLF